MKRNIMCDLCLHLDMNFAYVDKVARRGVGWRNREMEVQLWGRDCWKRKFGNMSERNRLMGNRAYLTELYYLLVLTMI